VFFFVTILLGRRYNFFLNFNFFFKLFNWWFLVFFNWRWSVVYFSGSVLFSFFVDIFLEKKKERTVWKGKKERKKRKGKKGIKNDVYLGVKNKSKRVGQVKNWRNSEMAYNFFYLSYFWKFCILLFCFLNLLCTFFGVLFKMVWYIRGDKFY